MPAQDQFLGSITLVGFNFAPVGWAFCNGQLMAINQNQALFALLGTQFGGDGQTTFALPDLRGRVPVHQGQGAGLSNYVMGEVLGSESVTLTTQQIPAHTHTVAPGASSGEPTTDRPDGAYPSANGYYSSSATSGVTMPAPTVSNVGGNQPHSNIQPVLALNFIIALEGIFPSQN